MAALALTLRTTTEERSRAVPVTTKATGGEEAVCSGTFDHPGEIVGRDAVGAALAIADGHTYGITRFGRWRARGRSRRDLATPFFHPTPTDDVAVGVDTGDDQELGVLEATVDRRTTDAVATIDPGALVREVLELAERFQAFADDLPEPIAKRLPDLRDLHAHIAKRWSLTAFALEGDDRSVQAAARATRHPDAVP